MTYRVPDNFTDYLRYYLNIRDILTEVGKPYQTQIHSSRSVSQRHKGNSDRQPIIPIMEYTYNYPHVIDKSEPDSNTHIVHMHKGDFFSYERTLTLPEVCEIRIELVTEDDIVKVWKSMTSEVTYGL